MKSRFYFIAMLLGTALLTGISGFSQTKVFKYNYDASGNRIERQFITLKSARIASSDGNKLEKEVFEGLLGEGELKIYPNPTKGMLRVEIPLNVLEEQVFLRVYNMQGTLVADQLVSGETSFVDLGSRPSGLYIMKISSGMMVSEWKIVKE